MKINTYLDFQGNEIKLATPEKVTTLPDSNLFVGRTCILISEKEVDETTINVGTIYYYNGEQWCNIEEPLKIDETKINVIDDEITLHKFDTLSDTKTYINSNNKPKSVIIGSNAGVTSIGVSVFNGCTSLTSINIPSGVTSIGVGVFNGCTSLTSITIPSSVTSIGNYAFNGCKSLTSITIPDSVTSIGSSAFGSCTSLTSITIPSSVTSIDNYAFNGCKSLTSITIPSGVTSIGSSAFGSCTSLTSITIPSSVTSIGNYAFNGCKSLTSITIPSGVTSIDSYTFEGCTSLTSITIPSSVTSIGNYAFKGCDILLLDNYKSRTGYPWGASNIYIQNENVTTTLDSNSTDRQVATAKTVYDALSSFSSSLDQTKINVMCDGDPELYTFTTVADAKTFINSTNVLKHVVIGSNMSIVIGPGAFSGCTSLASITIPSSVTNIGSGAFSGCTSLTSIDIPNSVTYIDGGAFAGCTSLTSITIPNNVSYIIDGTFNGCTSLTSITIPSGVTNIGGGAFAGCTSLKSITIPSSVTIISSAFTNCTSLTSITIPSGVVSIASNTFSGCTSLTSVSIPNSVTSIGATAFRDCKSLTSITIPDSVTSIGSNAFAGCDILILDNYKSREGYPWGATSILIHNEDVTTTIDSNSTDKQVPTAKTVYDALSSSGGSSLDDTKINVMCEGDPELYTFTTIADAKTFIDSTNALKHVVIGSNAGVTSIGDFAFMNCISLASITIPDSVTSIGSYAFAGCSLASITIPDSVTSIGSYAFTGCPFEYINISDSTTITSIGDGTFNNCTSLTFIDIPDSVTSIGESVFENCTSLTSIFIRSGSMITSIGDTAFGNCTSLTSITIPSSVTSIGDSAFSGCTSLASITIPSSVTSIGLEAFAECTSLTRITIPSNVTSIGDGAFSNCDILLLDNYKSRTGYPWGASEILIQNEDVTTTIDENSTDKQVPTAKAIYNFTRPIFGIRYGFKINKNNSDPDTRVEYLYDAVGMTPAKMTYDETTHKGTFDYGSWGNVWFIKNNRPVKLNFNGTVEAELNPNNYWETIDGQDSELETSTDCNFMSEIPIVYVKRWEDENYNYVVVCDKQYDEDYLAYANTDKDGNLKPLYAPMFKGYKDSNNILRSIAGVDPLNNTTTSNEVMYSNNINTTGSVTGWQIEDIAKHELISDLLTLISKNTDSQTVFGNGVCQTSTRVFTGYNEIVTDTKTVKSDCGQFCGYNDDTHHVSIFHIQDFWGNRWDRCLGLITSGGKYYYKMTPENGGYVYSGTITDYTNNGYTIAQDYSSNDITPPANGYIKNQSTGIFGNLPINTTGASDSTYYCDNYWYNSSGVCLLRLGGRYDGGRYCGSRCFYVSGVPSAANVSVGASPFYV